MPTAGTPTSGTTKRVDRDRDGVDDRAEGAGAGAGIGAGIGGAAGLLAGLGLLAIPGVGPVVAAGWLVATAAGAAAGGLTGGIVGALTQAGVSDDDAQVYAEGVRRGGTLVTARVNDADAARLEAMLDRSSLRTTDMRSSYDKSGWKGFDPERQAVLGRRGPSVSQQLAVVWHPRKARQAGPFFTSRNALKAGADPIVMGRRHVPQACAPTRPRRPARMPPSPPVQAPRRGRA